MEGSTAWAKFFGFIFSNISLVFQSFNRLWTDCQTLYIIYGIETLQSMLHSPLEYRLYGVIQDVVFTHQPHFSCSFLSLICLSTNQNIQLIHSLLIRIEWTTGNGILMSSSHWPIYNKFPPGHNRLFIWERACKRPSRSLLQVLHYTYWTLSNIAGMSAAQW